MIRQLFFLPENDVALFRLWHGRLAHGITGKMPVPRVLFASTQRFSFWHDPGDLASPVNEIMG